MSFEFGIAILHTQTLPFTSITTGALVSVLDPTTLHELHC